MFYFCISLTMHGKCTVDYNKTHFHVI